MRVFAWCARSWRVATWRASGVWPRTCPPDCADRFDPAWFQQADLLYFNLHGAKDQGWWYGDGWLTALAASQLEGLDLMGKVAFAENCEAQGPMAEAFVRAGAIFVGGVGEQRGNFWRLRGPGLLGRAFVRALRTIGVGWPDAALGAALAEVWPQIDEAQRLALGTYRVMGV